MTETIRSFFPLPPEALQNPDAVDALMLVAEKGIDLEVASRVGWRRTSAVRYVGEAHAAGLDGIAFEAEARATDDPA